VQLSVMLRWLCLLLGLFASAGCSGRFVAAPESPTTPLQPPGLVERPTTRVLLVGDSITFGISSSPQAPGYAEILPTRLGAGFEIVNVGCGGSNAVNWRPSAGRANCLGRINNVVFFDHFIRANASANIATVLLGSNDAAIRRLPPYFRRNLEELIDGIHAVGIPMVVLMTPPPVVRGSNRVANSLLKLYAKVVGDPRTGLCRSRAGVVCGPDLFQILDAEADFSSEDPHPNARGHEKIAAALADTLAELFPSSVSTDRIDLRN